MAVLNDFQVPATERPGQDFSVLETYDMHVRLAIRRLLDVLKRVSTDVPEAFVGVTDGQPAGLHES